jgi:site-specific recombinase XerD
MSHRLQTDTHFTNKTRELLQKMPDFVRRYIRSIHNATSARTQYEYLKDIQQYFRWLSQTTPTENITLELLAEQTKEDFEDYLEYIEHYEDENQKQRTNGRTSIKRKLSSLRKFFAWLFANDYLPSDEIRKITIPKITKKEIIHMEETEVKNFLNSIQKGENLTKRQMDYHQKQSVRDMAIACLMLSTGIRVSECAELDVTDVDMQHSCIHITRKGGNESTVYFSDEASAYLQTWLEQRAYIKIPDSETALFLSSRKKRLSVRSIEILIVKYAQRAIPGKHITPHKLRSTFATSLYQETGDIYLVAETLGHKDITTTKEHYAKLSDSRKRDNRNKIKLLSQ